MDKVSWELMRGVQSLLNLISILEDAIQSSQETKIKRFERLGDSGSNGFSFYVNATQCWCGVNYAKPQVLVFEAYNVSKGDAQSVGCGRFEKHYKESFKWLGELDLESENVHFFALSSENQQKSVEDFVTKSISAVKTISPIAATA